MTLSIATKSASESSVNVFLVSTVETLYLSAPGALKLNDPEDGSRRLVSVSDVIMVSFT